MKTLSRGKRMFERTVNKLSGDTIPGTVRCALQVTFVVR